MTNMDDSMNHRFTFRGNNPRSTHELAEWHAAVGAAEILEPEFPIVDAHHHLFGTADDALFYRLDELKQDLSCGHRIVGTVYVEAYESGWRQRGPEALRAVGEVETIAALSQAPVSTPHGDCEVAAGIVAHADLRLGEAVAEVIEQELAAAGGRLRGIRMQTASVNGAVGDLIRNRPPLHLLEDAAFRRGFAVMQCYGLSFDATVYHTQLMELASLADTFPDTTIVLNHIGVPIGVAEFESQREAVLAEWDAGMRALALRPNVVVKIGGLGMPVFGFGFERGMRPATHRQASDVWRPFIEFCVRLFGTRRCMFESAFPVDKQSCSYAELWNAFKHATRALSRSEREDLFFRSACQVYRLSVLQKLCETTSRADRGEPEGHSEA